MCKHLFYRTLCILIVALFVLVGCNNETVDVADVVVTTPIEVTDELLSSISVILPDNILRKTISGIQHDFILDDRQIGGIVIVDIPAEMLESPRENTSNIAQLLGQQLMPATDLDEIKYQYAGGNSYAYMEIATGKTRSRYIHYLFRGNTACYDVWFDLDAVKQKTINEILASVSAEDITDELNENVF